jgi:hypothetical protein
LAERINPRDSSVARNQPIEKSPPKKINVYRRGPVAEIILLFVYKEAINHSSGPVVA